MKINLEWPRVSVVTLICTITLCIFSGTASAANRIFDLYLRNGDLYDTITFKISDRANNCYEGTPAVGQQVGGPVKPGGYVTIRIARVQGHGCDGEQGQFAVEPSNSGGALVYFNFDNAGSLQLSNVPNAYVGQLSRKNPQNETYTWSTLPRPAVTASRPVGSWEHVCQQFCNETFTQEIINTATNRTETSQETKTALSATLNLGIEFPGGSAGGSVTASEERTVGQTMSRELASSRANGKSTTVALTLEQMEERELFAVWQWVVTSRMSTGENVVLTTTKYTCTRDANPPTYLPGSRSDIEACKKPRQVAAAPTPKPQQPAALPNMQGSYQRGPVLNDWHIGQITGNPMRWTNKAGASWGFDAQPSSVSLTQIVWQTNQENPYFNNANGKSFIFTVQNGQIVGFTFNGENVLYRRIGN